MAQVMEFKGSTRSEFDEAFSYYTEHTRYESIDFSLSTILYAKDANAEKEKIQYYPLRPCDMEEFLQGAPMAQKSINVDFQKIPQNILSGIDPSDNQSSENMAFMFDEGMPSETVYFLDPKATHSIQRLPIEKADRISFARAHMLAENLSMCDNCTVTMTIRIDEKGAKRIVGFSGSLPKHMPKEYVYDFIKAVGTELLYYKLNDKTISLVLKSNLPATNGMQPCYMLMLSDSGYGEPTLVAGLWDYQNEKMYNIADRKIDSKISDIQQHILDLIKELRSEILTGQSKLQAVAKTTIPTTDVSGKVKFLTKEIMHMPHYKDILGDKKLKVLLNECREGQHVEEGTDVLMFRIKLLHYIVAKTEAVTAMELLCQTDAYKLLAK